MENNDKSYVEIFNAAQYLMLETIREITLLHTSLSSSNVAECKAQLEQIQKHLSVLEKMVDNIEDFDDFDDDEVVVEEEKEETGDAEINEVEDDGDGDGFTFDSSKEEILNNPPQESANKEDN